MTLRFYCGWGVIKMLDGDWNVSTLSDMQTQKQLQNLDQYNLFIYTDVRLVTSIIYVLYYKYLSSKNLIKCLVLW